MRATRAPTRFERLVNDLTLASIDLQALANRLQNTDGLSVQTRSHAFRLAEAGRAACLAAVQVNGGNHTQDLLLHYGQFLTTSAKARDKLDPLQETGVYNKFNEGQRERAERERNPVPVNVRRAALVAAAARTEQDTA